VKWIILKKAYFGKPIGEKLEVDAADAADLIAKGIADEVAEDLDAQLKAQADEAVAAKIVKAIDSRIASFGETIDRRASVRVVRDNADEDPKFGFKSIGEQVRVVKGWYAGEAASRGDERMNRLVSKAPTTYANEGTGADGGFLLAPEFSNQVLMHSFMDEALFSRTDTYTTGSNSLTVPKDETTPWGTNGVQVYWQSEAGQATQSKPKLGQDNLILHKLTALVPVTDEQLQDGFVGLGQYVTRQAGERIRFKVDEAIVNGSGAGQPLGIINSGPLLDRPQSPSWPSRSRAPLSRSG
jgi:HK97 family phage major capsid protein